MALEVEDGTGKANADSYVSAADAEAAALLLGYTLTNTEVKLRRAMVYLEAQRDRYQGSKTYAVATVEHPAVQALQWPRADVVIDGEDFAEDAIPAELVKAQIQLAIEQENGFDIMPSSNGRVVVKEKVDVLEVQYATPQQTGGVGGVPSFPAVEALLAPLYGVSSGFPLSVVRV
jgi:hypothetical protein